MGVMDKMMEFMMPRMMKRMNKMVANAKPEDVENFMGHMHEAMEHAFEKMEGEELGEALHDMMPKMMDGCFAKMDEKARAEMLVMCRDMLNEVEAKYAPAPAAATQKE